MVLIPNECQRTMIFIRMNVSWYPQYFKIKIFSRYCPDSIYLYEIQFQLFQISSSICIRNIDQFLICSLLLEHFSFHGSLIDSIVCWFFLRWSLLVPIVFCVSNLLCCYAVEHTCLSILFHIISNILVMIPFSRLVQWHSTYNTPIQSCEITWYLRNVCVL